MDKMQNGVRVIDVEQPVEAEVEAERHVHQRRVIGSHAFVYGCQATDDPRNVYQLVIL